MRSEIEKAIKEMINDPKTQEIFQVLGSDYDEHGIPYWKKNETNY